MLKVRPYRVSDEKEWVALRAKVVARSHSWDFVERKKVSYVNESIELVILDDEKIVGYLDAEIEKDPGSLCWGQESKGVLIQEFGVAPQYQKQGNSKKLLLELASRVKQKNIQRIELWTKESKAILIYQHWKLAVLFSHYHFRSTGNPDSRCEDFLSMHSWFAYWIDSKKAGKKSLSEIEEAPYEGHDCMGFEWDLLQDPFLLNH